jgi:hypothetical protein
MMARDESFNSLSMRRLRERQSHSVRLSVSRGNGNMCEVRRGPGWDQIRLIRIAMTAPLAMPVRPAYPENDPIAGC